MAQNCYPKVKGILQQYQIQALHEENQDLRTKIVLLQQALEDKELALKTEIASLQKAMVKLTTELNEYNKRVRRIFATQEDVLFT